MSLVKTADKEPAMEFLVMCAVIPASFGLALLLQFGTLKIILRALQLHS